MISLSRYVGKKPIECDAHTHLFDGVDSCPDLVLPESKLTVAFADIRFADPESYADGMTSKAYDRFISKDYPKLEDRLILLSTAPSADEAIKICEDHKDVIKGFGEFKCYGYYRTGKFKGTQETKKLDYGNLKWIEPALEYNSKNMPVYIHYSIYDEKRVRELSKTLERYPDTPFVLCHCGMGKERDRSSTLDELSSLMSRYNNLWTDISFSALDKFVSDRNAIDRLQKDRVLIGSDLNHVLNTKDPLFAKNNVDSTILKMEIINGYGVDFYGNLKRLFNY
jgi:hypothetical protein